jgi:hypothetical protein
MQKVVIILFVVLLGTTLGLGYLYMEEKNKPAPRALPPLVFQELIDKSDVVKAEKHIAKVYAICNPWHSRVANYVMAWSATINYAYDLKSTNITKSQGTNGVIINVAIPEIKIINNGRSLIGGNDFYKFTNKLLILKNNSAGAEHFKGEKIRAEKIARYYAEYALVNDKTLLARIAESVKQDIYLFTAQTASSEAIENIVVNIAPSTLNPVAPESPNLCEDQPFDSIIALSDLPDITFTKDESDK